MDIKTKIRTAYLRAHDDETFHLNITGNLRLLLKQHQTTNTELYSGNAVVLTGGGCAYWKPDEGYFFVCGTRTQMTELYDCVFLSGFDAAGFASSGGEAVVSLREYAVDAPRHAQLGDFEGGWSQGNLTAYDKALLNGDWGER